MNADVMELTNFHLGRQQKQALKSRAQASGTNLAVELRSAVDAYLAGVTQAELSMLDAASRRAEADIAEMNALVAATNRRAEQVFAELASLRGIPSPSKQAGAGRRKRAAR